MAPRGHPALAAVTSAVRALLAGSAVTLRRSAQTPLCAERFRDAFAAADLPDGVFSVLHCDHAATERMITSPGVDFVAFTGSVDAGRAIARAAAQRFLGSNLELGGKDPAYVRPDPHPPFPGAQHGHGP